jgi:hypothetical protein
MALQAAGAKNEAQKSNTPKPPRWLAAARQGSSAIFHRPGCGRCAEVFCVTFLKPKMKKQLLDLRAVFFDLVFIHIEDFSVQSKGEIAGKFRRYLSKFNRRKSM